MKQVILFAAVLVAGGCGQSNKPAPPAAAETKAPEYFHVDPATAGTLSGKVVFRGTLPPKKVISMAAEKGCEEAHAGKPVYDESVVVGKGGGLANAFVYIQSGLEGKKFEPVKESVILDQHGCIFVPRVVGMRPGQPLELKNSDTVSHNIHPMPKNNWEWNQEQAPQAPDSQHKFARQEIMIPVKCNVHSWMRAWVGVVDHPYFAVTGPDGSFELKNVPPGDYTIAVWHEKFGEQKQQIHIGPSASAAVDFTYR